MTLLLLLFILCIFFKDSLPQLEEFHTLINEGLVVKITEIN